MSSNFAKLSTGSMMPLIGLGTWQAKSEAEIQEAVLTAIKTGYRHIDTAFVYGNEKSIGDALQTAFKTGLVKREEMFVVTKLPGFGHRPEKTKLALEKSLKKLQMSYVDLYLIHFPVPLEREENSIQNLDKPSKLVTFNVDMMETWRAMEKLVDEGLTKSIGLSNYNSLQIKTIYEVARIKPANLQVECNAYLQQDKLFEFCKTLGITFTAYGPIGSPAFPRFAKEALKIDMEQPPSVMKDPVIVAISKTYNKTPAQICLRWLVQRGIIVVPKSTSPQRIKENFQIFDFQLTEEEMSDIKKVDRNLRLFIFKDGGQAEHPQYPFHVPF